jgi:ABC-type lipoprotein export system ATPase subunit
VRSQNLALLMATHNHDLARRIGRVVEIRNGVITESKG